MKSARTDDRPTAAERLLASSHVGDLIRLFEQHPQGIVLARQEVRMVLRILHMVRDVMARAGWLKSRTRTGPRRISHDES